MKKIFVTILALVATNLAFGQMPDVAVENHLGETISTKSLLDQGKPMIISFWSTTCKACIQELKAINDEFEDWQREADFSVVAVSIDDVRSAGKAKAMAAGNNWVDKYELIYDKNQDFKRAMNVNLIPHVFLMDREGNIVYSHTSYTPGSEYELLKRIKELQ